MLPQKAEKKMTSDLPAHITVNKVCVGGGGTVLGRRTDLVKSRYTVVLACVANDTNS